MDQILKASYGDKNQRELNQKKKYADNNVAAKIEKEVKERKAARPLLQVPIAKENSDPPFWNAKYHGAAFGDFKEEKAQLQKKMAKIEIRPGVFKVMAVNKKTGGEDAKAKQHEPTRELAPALAKLEDDMREQLKRRAAVHITERTVLLRAFARGISKPQVELGSKVTVEQFIAVWKSLGLRVDNVYAKALFNKYGHDRNGMMPIMVFVEALVVGEPRQLMLGGEVQHGAYNKGQPATHMGKIQYPECKKGVWPPSDWDPKLAERSAEVPDATLELEFVYGYDGILCTSPNIFYLASGEIVWYVAAVCIIYNQQKNTQRLFLGHTDDINGIGLHPNRTYVASGQLWPDGIALVWDSTNLKILAKLQHGEGSRGVQAVAFSGSGQRLATISLDNSHTLTIWNWEKGVKLMERKSQPGVPPSVYGVVWSHFSHDRIVTYGQNHIRFWSLQQDTKAGKGFLTCESNTGKFNKVPTHTVMGAAFLPSGIVLSGHSEGSICSWKGNLCIRQTSAHAKGPLVSRPDGTQTYGGVRCLVLQSDRVLLSGGSDGFVIKWDVSSGDLGPQLQRLGLAPETMLTSSSMYSLRGLDCMPGSDMFIAGTSNCDVWEVDATPTILVYGSRGDLYGLATNPEFPHIFATVCDSDEVAVWNAVTRKLIRQVDLGMVSRACAFSRDGSQLAVGTENGGIRVLEFHPEMKQVYWCQIFTTSVDVIKYSPDGRYLAAAGHDHVIDVLDVASNYARVARCSGHSAAITHFDWSVDCRTIQSNDHAYELLYFDAMTGKQVKENQRDTQWATWTCVLGFPVMGIWPPNSDGTDVNAVDRSPCGRYLATSDDFGKIKLFNYPVVIRHAPSREYPGHSSHVMNVRWSSDGRYAVSVGGRDRGIFQWRFRTDTGPSPAERMRREQAQQAFVPVDAEGKVWAVKPKGPPRQAQQAQLPVRSTSNQQPYRQPPADERLPRRGEAYSSPAREARPLQRQRPPALGQHDSFQQQEQYAPPVQYNLQPQQQQYKNPISQYPPQHSPLQQPQQQYNYQQQQQYSPNQQYDPPQQYPPRNVQQNNYMNPPAAPWESPRHERGAARQPPASYQGPKSPWAREEDLPAHAQKPIKWEAHNPHA